MNNSENKVYRLLMIRYFHCYKLFDEILKIKTAKKFEYVILKNFLRIINDCFFIIELIAYSVIMWFRKLFQLVFIKINYKY